jgi:uncharacterized protein (TIGR03083 family)
MALRQFYDPGGVPLVVVGDPQAPAAAWQAHRARVRGWLDALPDEEWGGPTRCELWDVTALVRHLASGSQFLGYTLHQSARGEATSLLQGFDPHSTVQAAAAMLGELTPTQARAAVAQCDSSVDRELSAHAAGGWVAVAEAPPGQLPASLAVSHFVFDSWVHEYDLMLPRGERPLVEPLEVQVVVSYLMGLATLSGGSAVPLDVRLTDVGLRLGVVVADGVVTVSAGDGPAGAAVVEGAVVDVVDRATGRTAGPVDGDERGLAVLDAFGKVLAG